MGQLTGLTVGIVVADGAEQVEVTAPREALGDAGANVRVLSPSGAPFRGYHYIDPGDEIRVDGSIAETDPADLNALIIPGGLGGPDTLRKDPAAVALVREVVSAGKPVGVICHGPWLLIEADALAGRTLTCVPQLSTDVAHAGATYVDADVHIDDADGASVLISSRDHNTAQQFAEAVTREFAMRLAPR